MTALKTWLSRLLALFRKRALREEFDQEVRLHLEMETAQNLRRGMGPEEAGRAARWRLGGVDQATEAWWDQRGLPALESLVQDVRYGLRSLARSPIYAAAAVLSLALGIGAGHVVVGVMPRGF